MIFAKMLSFSSINQVFDNPEMTLRETVCICELTGLSQLALFEMVLI